MIVKWAILKNSKIIEFVEQDSMEIPPSREGCTLLCVEHDMEFGIGDKIGLRQNEPYLTKYYPLHHRLNPLKPRPQSKLGMVKMSLQDKIIVSAVPIAAAASAAYYITGSL